MILTHLLKAKLMVKLPELLTASVANVDHEPVNVKSLGLILKIFFFFLNIPEVKMFCFSNKIQLFCSVVYDILVNVFIL